jgi:hypothetical protein
VSLAAGIEALAVPDDPIFSHKAKKRNTTPISVDTLNSFTVGVSWAFAQSLTSTYFAFHLDSRKIHQMGRRPRRRDPQDSLLSLYAHDVTVRRIPTQISAAHAKTLLFDVPFVIVQFEDYLLFAILAIMVDMLSTSNLGLRSMTNAQLVVAAAVPLLRTFRRLILSNSWEYHYWSTILRQATLG